MRSHESSVKDMKSDRLFGSHHRQNKKDPRVFFIVNLSEIHTTTRYRPVLLDRKDIDETCEFENFHDVLIDITDDHGTLDGVEIFLSAEKYPESC